MDTIKSLFILSHQFLNTVTLGTQMKDFPVFESLKTLSGLERLDFIKNMKSTTDNQRFIIKKTEEFYSSFAEKPGG